MKPITPMALDIAAMQNLYGVKAANTMSTTYTLKDGLTLDGNSKISSHLGHEWNRHDPV